MKHKKNWDLEIPHPNQSGSIRIYILWGEEDRKEGSQISGNYCETVKQEGGEIFMVSNGIRFLPFTVSDFWVFLRLKGCETIEQKFKPFVFPETMRNYRAERWEKFKLCFELPVPVPVPVPHSVLLKQNPSRFHGFKFLVYPLSWKGLGLGFMVEVNR